MPCKSFCHRYTQTVSQRQKYTDDRKHCTVCDVWVPSDTVRCRCCGNPLRTKSRIRKN